MKICLKLKYMNKFLITILKTRAQRHRQKNRVSQVNQQNQYRRLVIRVKLNRQMRLTHQRKIAHLK